MNRIIIAFLILFSGVLPFLSGQIVKLPGAIDPYIPQPIKEKGIRELSVIVRSQDSESGFPLIMNKYNASGKLVDSTDQAGDSHRFMYSPNGRLAKYEFLSTSFEYEKMTGIPEYKQSKVFSYDAKGHLVKLEYFQLDSLSHTIDFTLDQKGRTIAYHSRDQFDEPSFMGFYTYTKFDSVLRFEDFAADSTPILVADYIYNKKKQPVSRVEKTPGTPAITEWSYSKTATGDSTLMTIVEPSNNEAGMEIMRLTRQVLTRTMAKKKVQETNWRYYAIEYPEAEVQAMPEPKLLDVMIGYYDKGGKPIGMKIQSDGEPVKTAKIVYDDKGLIDFIEITNEESGQKEITVDYSYVFF